MVCSLVIGAPWLVFENDSELEKQLYDKVNDFEFSFGIECCCAWLHLGQKVQLQARCVVHMQSCWGKTKIKFDNTMMQRKQPCNDSEESEQMKEMKSEQ